VKQTAGVLEPIDIKHQDAAATWADLPWRGITPEQAEAWIEANVVDLASAKAALTKLAKALIALARLIDLE
jgi:hypothetical protein